ncbi:zinc finger protein 239-like isoform X1 [Periplaneta americana]|uniref:zinc finger protein 239-like isoform X1 n=2 Tax=Periplaneta americana TaxID=6978 RepID=UPI0037E7A222
MHSSYHSPQMNVSLFQSSLSVVMDVIKTEPEVDPLAIQSNGARDFLLEEENLLDQHMTGIKSEYEIKVEEAPESVHFPLLKSEAEKESRDLTRVNRDLSLQVKTEGAEARPKSFEDQEMTSQYCSITQEGDATLKHSPEDQTWGSSADCNELPSDMEAGAVSFRCNICDKDLSNDRSLRRHLLTHSEHKPFKCDVCNNSFTTNNNLKVHYRLHSGEKRFKCDVCGKGFSERANLMIHTCQHAGEKQFKCNVCGKCFSHSGNLRNHESQHANEKSFKCGSCGKCFSHMRDLQIHSRSHSATKPFKCDVCGRSFWELAHLQSHSISHSGEKPFACVVCGKCFSHASHLKSHSRTHAGKKP